MRDMMTRLKLTVNETKTKLRCVPAETFDFLGYTFGRCYSPKTGRAYLGTKPSKRKIRKLCESLHELTGRRYLWLEPEELVKRLNCRLVGWANYFCLGPVSGAYRAVDNHVAFGLRRWLCRKHKDRSLGYARFPNDHLEQLGLVRLWRRTRNLPWAKA
jgi:hypothetical protein